MGAGNAGSTGGGGGGVGPAGMTGTNVVAGKTTRTYGTALDAQKTSERYNFRNRGAEKIAKGVKTPSLILNVGTKILSKPLQAGSRVTRDFFTDKVLGSKNFRGINKKDFLNKTEMQQEMIYGDYIKNRQTGSTDAYGNTINNQNGGSDNNQTVETPKRTGIFPGESNGEVTPIIPTPSTSEDTIEKRKKKTKATGRSKSIMTSAKGVTKTSSDYSLGKPSLLGQV